MFKQYILLTLSFVFSFYLFLYMFVFICFCMLAIKYWEYYSMRIKSIWASWNRLDWIIDNSVQNLKLQTFNLKQHVETFVLLSLYLSLIATKKKYLFFYVFVIDKFYSHPYNTIMHIYYYFLCLSLNTGLKNAKSKFGSFQFE